MAVELGVGYLSILPSTRGFAPALRKQLATASPEGGRAGQATGNRFTAAMGSAVKTAGKAGLVGVGVGAGAAVVSGFRSALGQARSQATLKGLYDSGSVAKRLMGDLAAVSRKSVIDYSSYTKAAEALAYMGVEGKAVPGMLRNMGLAITATGGGAEEMERASSGLLRMVNTGKVQADMLNQVSEAGIPIYDALASSMGVSAKQLTTMVTEGKVGIEDVQSAIQTGSGKVFAQQKRGAAEVNKTASAQFTMLKDNIGRSLGSAFRAGDRPAAEFLGRLNSWVSGGGLQSALSGLRDAFAGVWSVLRPGLGFIADNREVFAVLAAGAVAYKVATLGLAAGLKIQSAAARLASVSTWSLNAAMRANPIGTVVTILTLLGAALVLAYKRSATFRRIVTGAWTGIKVALSAAWGVISPILSRLRTWLGSWLPAAGSTLRTVFGVIFKAIGVIFRTWWTVARLILAAFRAYLTKLVFPVIRLLYTGVVRPVFKLIGIAFKVWWAAARLIFAAFRTYFTKVLFPVIRFLYSNVVRPVFGKVRDVIASVWRRGIRPVFSAIGDGIRGVGDMIGRVVRGIGSTWDRLRSIFATPVNWVIKNVINPFIKGLNKVSGWVGGPTFNTLDGVSGGGRRSSGSRSTGQQKMAGGGTVAGARRPYRDRVPTILAPGEEVISNDRGQADRHRGLLKRINDGAIGLAKGGTVWPMAGSTSRHSSGYGWARWAGDINSPQNGGAPVRAYKAGVVSAVRHLTTSYGKHVRINHGGMRTLYAHLSRIMVKVGQQVKAGQRIGSEGSTGNSTGPHLHFEIAGGSDPIGVGGGGGLGVDPIGKIKELIATSVSTGKKAPGGVFGKALGGSIGALSKNIVSWVKDKADTALSVLSPGYALGKGLLSKLSGAKGSAQKMTRAAMGAFGWGDGQWPALNALVNKESGWNPSAANPTSSARGLFQKMTSIHGAAGNVKQQIAWGLDYIRKRYGSPAAAWSFHRRHNYYARGTDSAAPGYAWVGERGPELLRMRGGEQVLDARRSQRLAKGGTVDGGNWSSVRWITQRLKALLPSRVANMGLGRLGKQLGKRDPLWELTTQAGRDARKIARLTRRRDAAKSDAARSKLAEEIRDLRADRKKTQAERRLVRRMEKRRSRLMVRQARRMPTQVSASRRRAIGEKYNALTLNDGRLVTEGFLSGELGRMGFSPAEDLAGAYAGFRAARAGAADLTSARLAAGRRVNIAKGRARPVQGRLSAVTSAIGGLRTADERRKRNRQLRRSVLQLARRRARADSPAERARLQEAIDERRDRQRILDREGRRRRRLRRERDRLQDSGKIRAAEKAQKRYNAAVEREKVAREAATKAAEAYKEAQEAAVERAKSITSAGIGLGAIQSAGSATSAGIVSNLRRAVTTTRDWGGVVKSLIGAGLRGPILDEFIDAGPSVEALRTGRSLLRGNQIWTINALQDELKSAATAAGASGAAVLPKQTARAPGTWSSSALSYHQPGQVGAAGGRGNERSVSVHYSGMPADTVDSIAAKTADRLMREAVKAGV